MFFLDMFVIQLIILLACIYLGIRYGSIAVGLAAGLGLCIFAVLGDSFQYKEASENAKEAWGSIPLDVVIIIIAIICVLACVQLAGGIDLVVLHVSKLLRKHPQHITFLAPIVTFIMTFCTGTGHTAYFTIPIIVDVATKAKIRPSRPLSIAVVASQIAVVASPVSAVVLFVATQVETGYNISYLTVLAITIPSTFLGVILASFFANKMGVDLEKDPVYLQRLKEGKIKEFGINIKIKKSAKFSLIMFLIGMVCAMAYAILSSKNLHVIKNPPVDRTTGIVMIMFAVAIIIVMFAKLNPEEIQNTSMFKNGMVAAVCVTGTAWMGNVFAYSNLAEIKRLIGDSLTKFPFLVAILFLIVSALMYSHAAAAKVIVPLAFSLGVSPLLVLSAMPMLNGYFLVPNYPTMIAATQMDYTGSTRHKGKNKFNQPFLPVCLIANISATIFAFIIGFFILH